VHAAVVRDGLHFDVHALVRHLELHVTVAFLAGQDLGRHAECLGPEARRAVQVVGPAIDDEACETALVHDAALPSGFAMASASRQADAASKEAAAGSPGMAGIPATS